MDIRSLRTLIVEDSEDDVLFILRTLRKGGYDPLHRRVETAEEMRLALREQTWDIVLSDYHLPLFSGLEAISLLRETGPDIPLIIVSGAIGEETAIQSMKAGACDYVMKGNLSRLIPAVERELKEAESRRARQRAEADLRESEHRFRFLAEQMVDIVWTADRNFRTTYVSPSVTRVLGFAPEERLSHSLEEAVTPASYNAIMKRFEEEMARRQTEGIDPDRAVVMEVEYRHKNGGTVWMENTVRGIWDDGGNLLGIHGVARDLTERKQAEAALQEKQARLEDAYRLARLGIWNWDRDTGALFWSDELYRLFGRDPSLPPPSLAEHARIYAPGCWERQRERNKRALQTGESYRIELEYTHTDGTRRWITSFGGPLYDPSGRIRGLQGTVQDITERRQAQEIRRREEEWKNLLFWLYEEAPKRGEKEIFDHTLERICALSGSAIGFFHQVSDDQRTLILTSWNRKALETCTALYNQHYTLDSAGNWVDCVREKRPFIYNDFPSSPNQKGLPEGHVPITRLLTVPVLEGDKVRIIFGVGNKPEPYDDFDLVQVQLMANDLQKILAQRRVEASLRESERRYREMLDLLPVTVFEADAAGRILSFNPAAYFTFLLPRGAIEQDRSLFDFVAPEEREHAKRHFKGVLQGKTSRMREYPMLRSDGSVFPGMILSRAISRGDRNIGLRGVVVDLSEIKAAQEALRLSEEKYRSIYENAMEGIFQITVDGHFISANPALARMHRFKSPEEMVAQVTDIGAQYHVQPETRHNYLYLMEKDGFVRNFEFEAYRRDRSRMWASINARAVKDRDGRVLYHEGTTEDVTWRKETEEQLLQAYKILQETNEQLIQADKLAAVGTLAAGVAHEILNPIHVIAMGISALETTQDLPEPVREAFGIFQRQIERVVRITKDLQQFSRKAPPEMEKTDLRALVESTLNLCLPQLRMEGIVAEVSAEDPVPPVWIDRNRMAQVLLNLVNNAIDAMHAQSEKRLCITLQRLPQRVLITVADTGSGIAEADHKHLFDPFFTTKGAGKGTGLGLGICHSIVRNHGGRIWAENNPQGGATFTVELPTGKP